MPGHVAEDRDHDEDGYQGKRQVAIGSLHSPQPELSNEPPPLADGFEWPPPLPEDPPVGGGDALAGDGGACSAGGETGCTDGRRGATGTSCTTACAGADTAGVEMDWFLLAERWCVLTTEEIAIGTALPR